MAEMARVARPGGTVALYVWGLCRRDAAPFLGGQGPPPAYCAALPRDKQAKLRDHLRATLPIERDGTIRLRARAFAARVTRPA
jgi:hypothetical protein